SMLLVAEKGVSASLNFIVLGVITSEDKSGGVALVKNKATGKVSAHKVGKYIDKQTLLQKVSRRHVTILVDGTQAYRLEVGAEVPVSISPNSSQGAPSIAGTGVVKEDGFERVGGNVKVTTSYKDSLINDKLSQVLMQAATEPFVKDGKIIGFSLWDIEKNSIFEKMGLINGDVVTHINNQPLNDAGIAIRTLNQLKNTTNAVITYIRGGKEQTLNVEVQ
ncbi:MAG: PDZ domain-containing protein, partial [Oligoflexales bacterium]|nr:PDZ domain-containing protein [Oligoflexales bacterium]